MAGILDGVLVADFSRVLAGPLATAMLADLGATVIKIERPEVGDDTRHWGPPWTASTSSYFESANRSKQSMTLDLDDPDDHAIAVELACQADVLVENFRAGALRGKGLGYEILAEANPGLVYCSITGFGSGLGADRPGYDFLVQAVGGLMSITGAEDGDPTKVGVALVDVLTSKDAYAGILAALYERQSSGHGQHVEVNLLSSLLGSLANQASAYLATGVAPVRQGNTHPSIAPYETLRCAGHTVMALACGNDRQFAALCQVLEAPQLAADRRFASNTLRVRHRPLLVKELQQRLAARPASQWVALLTDAGVPAGEVGDIGSAFNLAGALGLEPRVSVGPEAIDQVRHPVSYSRTPVTDYRRPPGLGEHNAELRPQFRPTEEK